MGFSWELVFSRWSLEKLRHGCDREAADYSPASLHGSCCARHRLDYVYIAAAAANVPVQGLDDLVTVGARSSRRTSSNVRRESLATACGFPLRVKCRLAFIHSIG